MYYIYHEYVCVCVCTHISLMGPVCALQVPMPYVSTYLYIPTYLIHGCSCVYKCMHVQGWWGRPARMVMHPASNGGRSRAEMSRRRRRAWKRAKRTFQPWLSGCGRLVRAPLLGRSVPVRPTATGSARGRSGRCSGSRRRGSGTCLPR